ncbi:hypothetical protein M877_00350 [Streptomyces niveus NCIMB 11891]|nr:hypothetical protein M877_00350 [Streptomyces niveus NCIMB 11891]
MIDFGDLFAGDHGRPGGESTRGPPAQAALRRLTATVRR